MEINLTPVVEQPGMDAKSIRHLRLCIGSWFAVFFAFSFLIPVLLYIGIQLFQVKKNTLLPQEISSSVLWKDRFWFLSAGDKNSTGPMLKNIDIPSFSCSEPVAAIPCGYGRLLPGNNEIWLPSRNRLGVFRDGHFSEYPTKVVQPVDKKKNYSVIRSRYFLYRGQPAQIEGEQGEWRLVVWHDNEWVHEKMLILPEFIGSEITQTLLSGKPLSSLPRFDGMSQLNRSELEIRCHSYNDSIHVFLKVPDLSLDGIYYTTIQLAVNPAILAGNTWCRLDFKNFNIFPFMLGGMPYLGGESSSRDRDRIIFYSLDNGEWKNSFSYQLPNFTDLLTILSKQKQNQFLIILSENEGNLISIALDAHGKEVSRSENGHASLWNEKLMKNFAYFLYFSLTILTLITLIVLSRFHKKMEKMLFLDPKGHSLQSATIIRRSIAMFVDLLIYATLLSIPLAVGFILGNDVIESFAVFATRVFLVNHWSYNTSNLYWVGYLVYVILLLVFFTWAEGRYAASPGKMLLKLRLIDEQGRPCGFKRVFLRNIIKIALISAMPIPPLLVFSAALSEKGKHIGDLVVSSLVVRKVKTPQSAPLSD
jgi:uncharacterized RDD family membrane protein YckC